ncbi:MAG: hypothetical protein OCC49_05815 [Fibrobacterales bacterium]
MAKRMIEVSGEMGIDIRIGINSGSCTIGNFGSENRIDLLMETQENLH